MLHHYGFGGILADDMGLGNTANHRFWPVRWQKIVGLDFGPSGFDLQLGRWIQELAPQLDLLSFMVWKRIEKQFFLKITKSMWLAMPPFVKTASFIKRWLWFSLLRWSPGHEKCPNQDCSEFAPVCGAGSFALSGTPIENHLESCGLSFKLGTWLLPNKKEFMKLPATESRSLSSLSSWGVRKKKFLQNYLIWLEVVYKNELEDHQSAIYLAQLQQMRPLQRKLDRSI